MSHLKYRWSLIHPWTSGDSVKVAQGPPCEGVRVWEFWLFASFAFICHSVWTLRTPVKTCPEVYAHMPNCLINNSTLISSGHLNLTYLKPPQDAHTTPTYLPCFLTWLNGDIIPPHVQAPNSWRSHLAFNPLLSPLGFFFKIIFQSLELSSTLQLTL